MIDNDIEQSIIDTFRLMVIESGYSKVSVKDLCSRASVSRKTFYSYFDDKRDLLRQVFKRDATNTPSQIQPIFGCSQAEKSAPLINELMYRSLYEQKAFYSRLAERDSIAEFALVMQECFEELHCLLASADGRGVSEKLIYAYHYGAGGTASVVIHWIHNDMRPAPDELAQWTSDWGMSSSSVGF